MSKTKIARSSNKYLSECPGIVLILSNNIATLTALMKLASREIVNFTILEEVLPAYFCHYA